MSDAISSCSLYLLSKPVWREGDFQKLEEALKTGFISAFQLRLPEASEAEIEKISAEILPLCHQYGAMFLLNNSAILAARVGADGVHLGGEDGSVQEARTLLGPQKTIGVSCYDSKDLALSAGEQGADYVSFGTFFPSNTKNSSGHPTPEILEWWSTHTVLPCVAIGGITAENGAPLVRAGADFIAVVSAVWDFPQGVEAGVRALHDAIARASGREN